jgi:hypothetical protein
MSLNWRGGWVLLAFGALVACGGGEESVGSGEPSTLKGGSGGSSGKGGSANPGGAGKGSSGSAGQVAGWAGSSGQSGASGNSYGGSGQSGSGGEGGAGGSGGAGGTGEMGGTGAVGGSGGSGGSGGGQSGPAPTIEDFWERRAYFELDSRALAPSLTLLASNVHYNADNDVEVFNGVTYWFTRAFKDPKKAECPGDHTHTLVRTSSDGGATWSAPVVVLENEPITAADGCSANDGDVFFDAETGVWHFLYQCLANQQTDPGWHLCHATRAGTPDGPFDKDPQNPISRGGDIWKQINPGLGFFDEGTPEIVEKRDGYFYITFHGVEPVSPIKIVRGAARTKDFHSFEAINDREIFSWVDASGWDIAWNGGSSFGGGQATITRQGDYFYEIIEASDTNGGCQNGQGWALGLLRAPSLGGPWEKAPQTVLARESHEPLQNGLSGPCHIGYTRFFRDAGGELRLALWRGANDRFPMESDPASGHFFFTLRKSAPAASFRFREGPGHSFALADVISRGDLQLALSGQPWVPAPDGTYALRFDGSPSAAVAQASPVYDRSGDFRLQVEATFPTLPPGKSGFIAGNPGHYWLELYQDGTFCIWVSSAGGHHNACTSILGDLGQRHRYEGELAGSRLRLYRDEQLVAESDASPPTPGGGLRLGSDAPVGDVLGPIVMDLDAVSFWDRSR